MALFPLRFDEYDAKFNQFIYLTTKAYIENFVWFVEAFFGFYNKEKGT